MKELAIIVAFALAAQVAVMGLFLWVFLPLGGTHPNTAFSVQGWSAQAVENDDSEKYEAVTCLACQQLHLVNPKTGKTLGENDE